MSETNNQQSRQVMQQGHQNQEPKKGPESDYDPQNKHAQQDNPQKQGHNDSKQGNNRQGIGERHDKEGKPDKPLNRSVTAKTPASKNAQRSPREGFGC